jgi:uncharacterized protein (TIGR02996 family)
MVLDSPDDEATRLVYADCLEQAGRIDEAELIRVQCRLSELERDPALEERQHDLLCRVEARLAAPLQPYVDRWWFRRGLIDQIETPAATFASHGERLFAVAPVRHLCTSGGDAALAELAATPLLGRLSGLTVNHQGDISPAGIQRLVESAHLPPLTRLALPCQDSEAESGLGAEGARVIARSPRLADLRHLDLSWDFIEDEGVAELLSSPHIGRLESLDLSRCDFSEKGVHDLCSSPSLAGLETLALSDNDLGERWAEQLCGSPHLKRLRSLSLCRVHDPADAAILARSELLHRLHTLLLEGSTRDDTLSTLLEAPAAGQLRELSIGDWALPPATVEALTTTTELKRLRSLTLGYDSLDDEAMEQLCASPVAATLSELKLSFNRIGDQGARALASTPLGARLTSLDLTHCRLSAAGVRALCSSELPRRLTTLSVGEQKGQPGDEAVSLVARTPFARLSRLHAGDTACTDAAFAELLGAPFAPNLRSLGLTCDALGDEALALLRDRARWPRLTDLTLHYRSSVHLEELRDIWGGRLTAFSHA